METARSIVRLCSVDGGDVDQRSDRLRFSAAGHRFVPIARFQGATAWAAVDGKFNGWEAVTPWERYAQRERLARLVAMVSLTRDFSSLDSGRHLVSARILRGSCDARIRRPLR